MNHLSNLLTNWLTGKMLSHIEKPRQGEAGKVYLPTFMALIGIVCCAMFTALAILVFYVDLSPWLALIPTPLALLSASLILLTVNCRIFYDDHGFTYRSFFGITRRYTYQDITAIRENTQESYLYVGKRRVLVDRYAVGSKEFIVLVKQRYSMLHPGKTLPKAPPSRLDPFNGHVSNVGLILFGFVLLSAFAVGLLIFTVVNIFFSPSTPENTIRQSVCFESYYVQKNELGLLSTDGRSYVIRHYGEPFDTTTITNLCNGIAVLTTYSEKMTPEGKEPYYLLKAVELGGVELLGFEETDRFYRKEFWPTILAAAVFCLIVAALITGSIIVGRNPQKYSQRTIRFFFRNTPVQ